MPYRSFYVLAVTLLLTVTVLLSVIDAQAIGTGHVTLDNIPPIPAGSAPAVTGTPTPAATRPRQEAASFMFTTGILDDFNRADGELGDNWSGDTENYAILGNELQVGSGEDIYWNVTSFGVGQVVTITLTYIDALASEIGLILKAQNISEETPAMVNVLYVPASGQVQVWTYSHSQGWQQRGTNLSIPYNNGDEFGAHVRADGQVDIYKNGMVVGSRSVTAWPYYGNGGYIGLYNINAGTTILDDFGGGTVDNAPTPTPTSPPCTDPLTCNPVSSITARWRCNVPECTQPDWTGAVIAWPWYAAFESNNRVLQNSRTVYPFSGTPDAPLTTYMKNWADGCQITAVSGTVLVIVWERGREIWQEIYLDPGESYTVTFADAENGVLIEGPDNVLQEFRVSLSNCTPPSTPRSFGETDTMINNRSDQADLLYAQQAWLGGSGYAGNMSIFVTDPGPGGQLRLGIYDDNGGSPGALLAETLPFTPVVGWNTQDLVTQILLTPGTYWLAFLPNDDDMAFASVSGTGTNWYASHSFSALPGSFPTFPTSDRETVKFSIYATLVMGPTAVSLEKLNVQSHQMPFFLFFIAGLLGVSITTLILIAHRKYQLSASRKKNVV